MKEISSKSNSAIEGDHKSSGKRKSCYLNASFGSDQGTPLQFRRIRIRNTSAGSFRSSQLDDLSSDGTPGTVINGSLHRSTPGLKLTRRSSSPSNVSLDRSVNQKIKQLVMNSAKRLKTEITDIFKEDDDDTEDEEMSISQFSTSIESPTKLTSVNHHDTPRGSQQKRRVLAKNLSQSFTMHSEDEDCIRIDREIENFLTIPSTSAYYRTDSGFNELTQSSTMSQEIVDCENKLNLIPNMDESMNLVN